MTKFDDEVKEPIQIQWKGNCPHKNAINNCEQCQRDELSNPKGLRLLVLRFRWWKAEIHNMVTGNNYAIIPAHEVFIERVEGRPNWAHRNIRRNR